MSHLYTYENEAQINTDLKCAICLDPFLSPLYDVRCGHIFCYRCLEKWLYQKQTCPICRQFFTQFVPATDERLLRELDGLLVRCLHCAMQEILNEASSTIIRDFAAFPQRRWTPENKRNACSWRTYLTLSSNRRIISHDDDAATIDRSFIRYLCGWSSCPVHIYWFTCCYSLRSHCSCSSLIRFAIRSFAASPGCFVSYS